ncbi:porin [Flavisolibacter tropicus]|uniref:porin n=1 Tax=Flavisolibacter tropicus TaxID=1492898 RepID=UPI000AA4A81D|nr:porin [Flavisolibacter tropicus]
MLSNNHNQTKVNRVFGKLTCWLLFFLIFKADVFAQRYLSDYDSTLFIKDTLRPLAKRFNNISFSGYIQPQFQVAQKKGTQTYEGGNFQEFADSRFMLRRARVKLDYAMPGKQGDFPAALFTFQIEATERDVNIRDVFVRVYEPTKHNASLTAGLFARPFGYEVNLSSSYRETPERGRMSQILMPSERDLGAMVSYESQKPERKQFQVKYDIGLFNGQGKSGPAEFDSYKDLISRLTIKPVTFSKHYTISGGLSFLHGGWVQTTKYRYEMGFKDGSDMFLIDSNTENLGGKAPCEYYGADMQLAYKHAWGKTEIRGEYWAGKQPGTATTTVNPGTVPTGPTYIRHFDGAFFYFLQNIINEKWEIMAKYDWYDPNTDVAGNSIGKAGTNMTAADVRYDTWGFGATHYFNANLKVLAYYSLAKNETTQLAGFTDDIKDNVFTFRIQMRF